MQKPTAGIGDCQFVLPMRRAVLPGNSGVVFVMASEDLRGCDNSGTVGSLQPRTRRKACFLGLEFSSFTRTFGQTEDAGYMRRDMDMGPRLRCVRCALICRRALACLGVPGWCGRALPGSSHRLKSRDERGSVRSWWPRSDRESRPWHPSWEVSTDGSRSLWHGSDNGIQRTDGIPRRL